MSKNPCGNTLPNQERKSAGKCPAQEYLVYTAPQDGTNKRDELLGPPHFVHAKTAGPSFGCFKVVETSALEDVFYSKLNAPIITKLPFKILEVPYRN